MANPNIVNVTSIYGKIIGANITTTTTAVLTNASGSGKIIKVNSIIVSNINGTDPSDVTVEVYKNQANAYAIASTVTIPADATLVVISKDTSIYLEENDSIRCLALTNGDLQVVCSYEEIS